MGSDAKLLELKAQLERLPPSHKLLLASQLVEQGKTEFAEIVAQMAVNELAARRLSAEGAADERD